MFMVYRYRVKSLNGLLNKQARAVNFVWNFCNDRQKDALKWGRKWLTGFDLNYLTAGASKELGLLANTINAVCQQYAKSRFQQRRAYLRYRGKRALGWIPIKGCDLKREGDSFRFASNTFRVFNSRPLPDGKIKDGSNFAQDSSGNWYLNIVIEVADGERRDLNRGVGIDLGLKDFCALSNGEKVENPRHFRKLADDLARAQRAKKRRRVAKVHARIGNARRDFLHKLSHRLVREFDYIAVGNVGSARLAKTRMAKSVLDAGWTSFRDMLQYKSIATGAWYEEVNESFTTQACSCCGAIPVSSPKGRADLDKRTWTCSDCGTAHDRDHNAALNILKKFNLGCGHAAPVQGVQGSLEDVNPRQRLLPPAGTA